MKLIAVLLPALLLANGARAADKAILELQRDMALLQDQMKTLEDKVTAIQALIQQVAQQASDNAAKSDARLDKFQAAVGQSIKSELGQLSEPIAGAVTKLNSLGGEVASLRDASGEATRQLNTLQSRIDDMNNVLKAIQSPAAAPPGEPQAGKLFTDAVGDMSGKQDMALQEFSDFLRLYPTDPLAAQAQFNIGQIHYGQNLFEPAVQDFEMVITTFPTSQQVPDAMYMKGLALLKGGHRSAAADAFRALVAKYPQISQASQAKDQLRTLPAASRPR